MGKFFGFIFKPIGRTLLIALAGQVFFLVSVLTMIPLRMAKNPVVDYNLFYAPILALLVFGLFYRACVETIDSRGYLYGYFAALVAWPLIGEVASMPVANGIITQFSSLNIKLLGGWFYVLVGWALLKMMWRTGAVKKSVCMFFLTFLSIWTFELYMDNYSATVPVERMKSIASTIGFVFLLASVLVCFIAWKAKTVEVKTVMGCVLYITFSLVIMGFGQWGKPSSFYVKFEAANIDNEIRELREEKAHLEFLRNYMLENKLAKPEELGVAPAEKGEAAHDNETHE